VAEVLVTIGMFAIEVLGYIIITRRFPVLPREARPLTFIAPTELRPPPRDKVCSLR
jgi:hypothetical protein